MKFSHILAALYGAPLDITEAGFASIDAIVRPHLLNRTSSPLPVNDLGKTDIFGTPLPDMLEVDESNGLAVIHISGPLIQHASLIEKSCGACSYQDIVEALDDVMADRAVENILLNIDSPGGQHCGVLEVADKIAAIANGGEKEIYAFTDSTMASAAYCLAAGSNGIFATRTSSVGSIGSIIAFLDTSKAHEEAGLRPVVLASGKYKGTAFPGTTLTQDQNDYLMDLVTHAAGTFKDHVIAYRDLDLETMEGQCFDGDIAATAGLIDFIVADLKEAKAALR